MATFNISITVPDNRAQEVLATITDHLGYSDPDGNNGNGTRAEYLRAHVRDHLRVQWNRAKHEAAQKTADAEAAGVTFE